MSWESLVGSPKLTAGRSQSESDRFGLSIGRIEVPLMARREEALPRVLSELAEPAIDIFFLRYPAPYVDWFAALQGQGRDLLFADTLVYWRLDLAGPQPERISPRPGLTLSERRISGTALDALVADVFADYANHYRANPLLDPGGALLGYQEWARRSAESDPLVTLENQELGTVGLATMKLEQDGTAEILLAGVRSGVQGTGLYPHLLDGCADLARRWGCRQLVISTQGHNTRVQRAWSRFGLTPVAAFVTLHALRPGLGQASPMTGTIRPRRSRTT